MENKYYTPTIEELSINQEVYLLDTGNYKSEFTKDDIYPMNVNITQLTDYPTIWVKTKSTESGHKLYEVYPDQIGLKYLDQSDIESLGWLDGELRGMTPFIFNEMDPDNEFQLYYQFDNQFAQIYNCHSQFIFQGTIKNKSELIKLMQQLNIK